MAQIISNNGIISNSRLSKNRSLLVPPDGPTGDVNIIVLAQGCGYYLPFPGLLYTWKMPGPPPPGIPSQQPDQVVKWNAYESYVGTIVEVPPYQIPIYVWWQAYQIGTPFPNGWQLLTQIGFFHFTQPGTLVDAQSLFRAD